MNAPKMQAPPTPPPGAGSYPSGGDVMMQQGQEQAGMNGQVDNPVIAGFQSIMMLIKALKDKGDPRAEQAAMHLQGLLQTLQGAPAEPPMAAPPTGAPEGQMPPQTPQMGPQAPPAGAPPAPPAGAQPAGAPAPQPPQAPMAPAPGGMPMNPAAGAAGKTRPMQQQPNPQGKRPVVLT